jgi:two-component system OmpR family sensor kinase
VTGERLTRQELGWLLAQEARTASKALREGMTQRKTPAQSVSTDEVPTVELTLDVLDGAIDMLSELEAQPAPRGRRGRFDLAALVYELSPGARIVMEPGAGTEVFGEEADLRRMVHVLVSQTPGAPNPEGAPDIHIRRQDDHVRLTVPLGPDRSATAELERRWLGRMALHLGGRLELEGGTESLVLPADGAADRREVTALRKELEQAQALGTAYARELGLVFSAGIQGHQAAASPDQQVASERSDVLVIAAKSLVRVLSTWVDELRGDASLVALLPGGSPLAQALSRRATAVSELLSELSRAADCPAGEPPERVDLRGLLKQVEESAQARAERHAVRLVVTAPEPCELGTLPVSLGVILRSLLDHAIAATPPGGTVTLRAEPVHAGAKVTIEDGGPPIPQANWADLLHYRVEPESLGRPPGIGLLVAHTLALRLRAELNVCRNSPRGSQIELVLAHLGVRPDLG